MRMHQKAVLLALLAMPVGVCAKGKGHPDPGSCPADVGAALAERCPCDGQKNHGQYVSCVVHFRNGLRKAGCLTTEDRRTIARCAARSTCGKLDAVLCCTSTTGTCSDPTPGDGTAAGVCSNDRETACDTAADCTETRARIAHDDATCTQVGGTASGHGSVCGACTTTSTTTSSTTTSTTVP